MIFHVEGGRGSVAGSTVSYNNHRFRILSWSTLFYLPCPSFHLSLFFFLCYFLSNLFSNRHCFIVEIYHNFYRFYLYMLNNSYSQSYLRGHLYRHKKLPPRPPPKSTNWLNLHICERSGSEFFEIIKKVKDQPILRIPKLCVGLVVKNLHSKYEPSGL